MFPRTMTIIMIKKYRLKNFEKNLCMLTSISIFLTYIFLNIDRLFYAKKMRVCENN